MMRRVLLLLGLAALATGTIFVANVHAAANLSVQRPAVSTPTAAARNDAIIERFSGELTALEKRLFADAADGRLHDFSLLDAALIGSGEDREAMLRHYGNRLASLLEELRPSIDPNQPPEKNAERVFEFLHQRVLHGGYRLECTDLRMAFDDGRYNCVSASVLFDCLAGGVGLNCCGLEAPGHAMSRVFLPDGHLDLETTCPRWFQLLHDPAKRAEALAKTLGPASKRDYSLLREVTPVQMTAMIYYNRGVDYLAEKRFAEAAAVNAKALRLDPQNATARGNFLATLNNWSIDCGASRHYAAAVKLLRNGMAFDRQYPAFQQNFVYLHHAWSEQLCGAGQYSEAVDLLRQAADELPEKEYLKQSLWDVYRRWARSNFEKGIGD
jgi:tetratricopeptide (TPR) repeat protein